MKLLHSIIGYSIIPTSEGIRYYVYLANGKRVRVTRKTFHFFIIKRG